MLDLGIVFFEVYSRHSISYQIFVILKVVQYKQTTRLEEKKKKALDLHLSFIVDQTEKYSSWLTAGLQNADGSKPSSDGEPTVDSGEGEQYDLQSNIYVILVSLALPCIEIIFTFVFPFYCIL